MLTKLTILFTLRKMPFCEEENDALLERTRPYGDRDGFLQREERVLSSAQNLTIFNELLEIFLECIGLTGNT